MTNPPCYNNGNDCPKRCVGCKADCSEWQEWLVIHAEETAIVKRNRRSEYEADRCEKERPKRIREDTLLRNNKAYRERRS